MDLTRRRAWIFDLDGTLTVAVHDFDAIRAELELPPGRPILEALAQLPESQAAPRRARLDRLERLERRLALQGRPAAGAAALLERLRERGARLGVLTRNTHEHACLTLDACGLGQFFDAAHVLGRDEAPPKPDPAGLRMLLDAFALPASDAVMVGDYLFDLQAGRAAGTATVWVDGAGDGRFAEQCDVRVPDLEVLARLLEG
ncbi:MAG: HAD family hydrolase [Planctomycetota bacterium]|nr:MAG: HAD family hydrolase [Planctomycetota bacterium]